MKKIIISLSVIAAVAAVAVGATGAFFSDTETSTGNTFTAGSIDLKIDNGCHWSGGQECPWQVSSWGLTDLGEGVHKFFSILDLKPGDWEEDTISLHVINNNAWACMDVDITKNDDMSSTEPELEGGDAQDTTDTMDGELAQNIEVAFWHDDGDNIFEDEESSFWEGTLMDLKNLSGRITLADSGKNVWSGLSNDPIKGGELDDSSKTVYIGKAFCFGHLTLQPGAGNWGFTCNGDALNNMTQSDSVMGDVSFYVEQARNNGGFLCNPVIQ